MPEVNLGDMSKIGALPPIGTYRFEILDRGTIKPNSKKDGHNIVLKLRIVDSWDPDFENYNMTIWCSLKVSVRWKLQEQLRAFTGQPWDDEEATIKVDDEANLTEPALMGVKFVGDLTHGDNGGKPVANIQNFYYDDGTVEIGPSVVDAEV